jgi:hypothetical protein
VRETVHGPIVNDAIPELKGSPPMALRWTATAGAPLIDGLMAELGMNGSSLNGILNGSSADAAPARTTSTDAHKHPAALNGGSGTPPA